MRSMIPLLAVTLYVATLPAQQPNTPTASLTFTGTLCTPAGTVPEVRAASGSTTMTISSGPSGEQPYALFWTPGFPASLVGALTPFGLADFALPGYSVLATIIDGIGGLAPTDLLFGTTTAAASRSLDLGIGTGTPGNIQATYQALVTDPAAPSGFLITQATQINYPYGPAGTSLALGDDDAVQIVLTGGLTLPYYGAVYSDIYVGSNGYATFSGPDTDWTESAAEFLSGPPKIAGFWDDLAPNVGGLITYSANSSSFAISYLGVPEYQTANSNTFRITITDASTIDIDWFGMAATEGIGGISPGASSPMGPATGASLDLSAVVINVGYLGAPTEAIFEEWPTGTFDLGGSGGLSPCLGAGALSMTLQFVPNPPTAVPGDQGYTGF